MGVRDFLRRRQATFDPPRFQGWGRRRGYFEGWYVKLVVPEKSLAYALIPGISYGADGSGHAFLQVLDGVAATSSYHRYPAEQFRPATDKFFLQLGPHEFSDRHVRLALPELQVDINYTGATPWQKRPLAPGIMGWYGFVPRMECYHGLVSYHHTLSGTINGQDAAGGVGYIEKDWGTSFPRAWIWLQSNHLSNTDGPACLMASVAKIPWGRASFDGFLAILLLNGRRYSFTTWTGARAQVEIAATGAVQLTFADQKHVLYISGTPPPGGNLASPIAGEMTGKINESLRGVLTLQLTTAQGEPRYRGTATWAGFEVSEHAPTLLTSRQAPQP